MRFAAQKLTLLLVAISTLSAQVEWKQADPRHQWSFPEDHWAHRSYRTEWWYFTGQLDAVEEPGRLFGYQFTFFRVGLSRERPELESDWSTQGLMMGHAAVTDIEEGRHQFSELLYREVPLLGEFRTHPDELIAWTRGPVATDGRWTLQWNGEAFDISMKDRWRGLAMELETRPSKPLVLQGPNGYSNKGAGGASLYYSFTRLETTGTLEVGGRTWKVRGQSWMDKEFSSSQLGEGQVGWDWFSLQLADGRDLMLYVLRREDGSVDFRNGTMVLPDGTPRYLKLAEWTVTSTDSWESPATGAVYPSRWRIEMPGERLRLEIVPLLADQENRSRLPGGVFYWEGAVVVKDSKGALVGRGYVELTGYGENNRPPV